MGDGVSPRDVPIIFPDHPISHMMTLAGAGVGIPTTTQSTNNVLLARHVNLSLINKVYD